MVRWLEFQGLGFGSSKVGTVQESRAAGFRSDGVQGQGVLWKRRDGAQ